MKGQASPGNFAGNSLVWKAGKQHIDALQPKWGLLPCKPIVNRKWCRQKMPLKPLPSVIASQANSLYSCWVFFFFLLLITWLTASSASQESIVPNIASLRKDQNSKYGSDSGCVSLPHHQKAVKVVLLSHFKWGQFVLRGFFHHLLLTAGFWIQKWRVTVTGNVGFGNNFSSAKLYGYKILCSRDSSSWEGAEVSRAALLSDLEAWAGHPTACKLVGGDE